MFQPLYFLASFALASILVPGEAFASSSIEVFISQITRHRIEAKSAVFMGGTDEISLPLKELHKIGCRLEKRNRLVCKAKIRGAALLLNGKGILKKSKQKNVYKIDEVSQPSALVEEGPLVTCQGSMGNFSLWEHAMNRDQNLLILHSDSVTAEERAAMALVDSFTGGFSLLANELPIRAGKAHSFVIPREHSLSFDWLSITPAFVGSWAHQIPTRFTDCELP